MSVAGLLRAVAPGEVASAPAERLEALLDTGFLAEAGWDPGNGLLLPPAGHPLLGWPVCRVPDCTNDALNYGRICAGCRLFQRRHSLTDEQLVTGSRLRCRPQRLGSCTVPGCPRPWKSHVAALCEAHARECKACGLAAEEFIASPQAVPLPSLGGCEVIACLRERPFPGIAYCDAHYPRLKSLLASRPVAAADIDDWARAEALPSQEEISLISKIKADLGQLGPAERAQVDDAVTVVRRHRTVMLGMPLPRLRQVIADIRPVRPA